MLEKLDGNSQLYFSPLLKNRHNICSLPVVWYDALIKWGLEEQTDNWSELICLSLQQSGGNFIWSSRLVDFKASEQLVNTFRIDDDVAHSWIRAWSFVLDCWGIIAFVCLSAVCEGGAVRSCNLQGIDFWFRSLYFNMVNTVPSFRILISFNSVEREI